MQDLHNLAELIKQQNRAGQRITLQINRPATIGHVGEFIASKVFDIELLDSASAKGIDGHFRIGPFSGRSVNIKWYATQQGLLDITPDFFPDYYLVMTGPSVPAASSKGETRPWLIVQVYLFDANELVAELKSRNVKIGIATSVRKEFWQASEVYPDQRNDTYILSDKQRELLGLFADL